MLNTIIKNNKEAFASIVQFMNDEATNSNNGCAEVGFEEGYIHFDLVRISEIPCGWFLLIGIREGKKEAGVTCDVTTWDDIQDNNKDGGRPHILNRWTGDIELLDDRNVPNWRALIRHYISTLPAEHQALCDQPEWASLWTPEPVRFVPAIWDMGEVNEMAELESKSIALEVDNSIAQSGGFFVPKLRGTVFLSGETPDGWYSEFKTRWILDCEVVDVDRQDTFTKYTLRPMFDLAKLKEFPKVLDCLSFAPYFELAMITQASELAEYISHLPGPRWTEEMIKYLPRVWVSVDGVINL